VTLPDLERPGSNQLPSTAPNRVPSSVFSLEFAGVFFGALSRIALKIPIRDLGKWTKSVLRLASVDIETASEFLRAGTHIVLSVAPPVRSQLLNFTSSASYLNSGVLLGPAIRSALTIAETVDDEIVSARLLQEGARIGAKAFVSAGNFLALAVSVQRQLSDLTLAQQALLLHILDVTAQFPPELVFGVFEGTSTFIIHARSERSEEQSSVLSNRLLNVTEELVKKDPSSAVNLFLSGVELLRLRDEVVIDRWIALCSYMGRRGVNVLTQFTPTVLESTKGLVTLAITRLDSARPVCLAAINASIDIAGQSILAAAYCYQQSASVLSQLSVESFSNWVRFGLENCADANRLRAYFKAQSKTSIELIRTAPGNLRLETIAPVLSAYIQMLIGKDVPIVEKDFDYDLHEPAEDGAAIQLPPQVSGLQSDQDCFSYYKAMTALEAGYLEFGSYEHGTEQLLGLRSNLTNRFPGQTLAVSDTLIDARTLLSLFPQEDLARRLFAVVENARIEHRLRQCYRGLRRALDLARAVRRQARPGGDFVLGFEPLLEVLFLEAVGAGLEDAAQEDDQEGGWLNAIRLVLAEDVRKDGAGVADSLKACLRLYLHLVPEVRSGTSYDEAAASLEEKILSEQDEDENEFENAPAPANEVSTRASEHAMQPEGTEAVLNDATDKEMDGAELVSESNGLAPASNIFFYDEWDNRINDYRPRWCKVIETDWKHADGIFVKRTMEEYRGLLARVRDQFQRMRPVGFRRLRSQTDGDEIDLEALTDYFIDRRSHKNPSDKIYSQRRHQERNVAVCFLLDMSGSTSSVIAGKKRILNIEKEALLLMSESLEAIGDPYAVYGFSGQGKEQVDFYRFKDFDERYGDEVRKRIGSAQWLVNTRLGAAIRHASWRLNQQPSATRLLILLSDARPKDDEYPDGGEDTKAALTEARESGVTPFCITFNQGIYEEEFEEMFEGVGYTIIDDVVSLPERLPGIYQRLTS